MPDRDIFFRTAARGWHKPLRQLCGSAAPAEVARFTLSALARELRTGGGLPEIPRFVDLLRQIRQGRLTRSAALEQLHRMEMTGSPTVTRVGCRAVSALVANPADLPGKDSDLPAAVTARIMLSLVDHHLFGRAEPELAGLRFQSEQDFSDFAESCYREISAGVSSMSNQVVRDPSAAHLKAPPIRLPSRPTTAELLDERLD
jgi:hypothetical protein